jgi:hypothetical protein
MEAESRVDLVESAGPVEAMVGPSGACDNRLVAGVAPGNRDWRFCAKGWLGYATGGLQWEMCARGFQSRVQKRAVTTSGWMAGWSTKK